MIFEIWSIIDGVSGVPVTSGVGEDSVVFTGVTVSVGIGVGVGDGVGVTLLTTINGDADTSPV